MLTLEEIRRHFNRHDPFAGSLGIELLEVGEDRGVAVMPLDERHRNGMGHAHGGAIFALADMAFATVSNAGGMYCVNAQSSISYLEPGRIGPLRGEARRIRSGKRLGTYEVRITDADGTLVAVATITGYGTGRAIPPESAQATVADV